MPNPTRYFSGTSLSYSINKDKIFLGTNEVDYGPSSTTKWYGGSNVEGFVIISDSFRQGLTTEANAYPIFWGTPTYTNNALLGLINELPERESLSPFSTLLEAVDWLDGSGKYLIQNFEYENFTTSGLTFLADASFCASYPLVGTTWYDLINGYSTSGNTNLFEFYPGNPVAEYGAITFDGSGGIATFTVDNNVRHTTTFTIDAWAYVRVFENSPILLLSDGSSIQYSLGVSSDSKLQFQGSSCTLKSSSSLSINTWYYLTITYNSGVIKFYINGSFDSQTTNSCVSNVATSTLKIGANPTTNDYFDGGVGICRVYNRELTSTEILYNYNNQSTRYSVIPPPPTPSQTPSLTPTLTPTVTQTITQTPTRTPTRSATPPVTPTRTPTLTPTPSATPPVTPTRTPTVTPTKTTTPTPTNVPAPTVVQTTSGTTGSSLVASPHSVVKSISATNGNIFVISFGSAEDGTQQTSVVVTSTPSLTWTQQVRSGAGAGYGDVRIFTASITATASYSITITQTTNTGTGGFTAFYYEISGEEPTLGGATASGSAQTVPSVSITTTRSNSLLIMVSSDWDATVGTPAYRDGATEDLRFLINAGAYLYHYRNVKVATGTYTQGLTAPDSGNGSYGTAVLEIRRPA